MAVVDKAPPAAALELLDPTPQFFKTLDGETPCVVTLPGNSSFNLALFAVTAIGTVNPSVAGELVLTLFGKASMDGELLPLGSSVPEPIGAAGDLDETMWMIRGVDLMVSTGSGKMQGLFQSNVASNPQAAIDLEHHPTDITPEDPLYVFAVGAKFTPTIAARSATPRAGDAPCTVKLTSLTIDA